ncbi:C-type lectin domain family 2 member B-like [Pyxicephalus adspersus]|uniref:C-type lectin domain family 2 member B-like n=1 Tax=Pyxicephalus adspersus TaxID=30357 RepID=UPI003B596A89
METADKRKKKLWLPSWKCVIITILVGSNIILIRVVEALVHKSQSLKVEINQWKEARVYNTQSADQLRSEERRKLMEIKKQLCVNTNGESTECFLCPGGWLGHRESCYYISYGKEHRSWDESRDACIRMGAHLLVMEDREQQEFLHRSSRHRSEEHFWIGLYKDGDEWKWVNSSLFQLSGETCAMLNENDQFYKTDRCEIKHSWICQKKALKI